MRNTSLILVLIVGAIAAGYFWGAQRVIQNPTSNMQPSLHEEGEISQSAIAGAHHIHALTYDAENNLLLGTHGGLFKSIDEGKTWKKVVMEGALNAGDWMSLINDPRDRKVMFAGGHDLGVVKSMDGGLTWMQSDNGIRGTDIHGLTINQRNPNMLFAYSVDNGIFRSEDGGASWHRIDDGPNNPGVRAFAYMAVQTSMDKSMGGNNWGLLFTGTADGIYQSFSCFCGWTKTMDIFDNTTVYTMATLHANLRTMYAGTKDGAWKSLDEGKTWKQLPELKDVKITAIAINPHNPQLLTASTEDGILYRSSNAGEKWEHVN